MIKKVTFYFFIPLILICLGVFAAILFNNTSISTLSINYSEKNFYKNPKDFLLKNEIIAGKFIATENNLGIIYVKFDKSQAVNFHGDDLLYFRIKKEDEDDWFYQNSYPINEFKFTFLLPFGFPIVLDSLGKTFIFEIESLNGTRSNSVKLSKDYPTFQAVYKFSKDEILSSGNTVAIFILKKIIYSFSSFDFFLSSIVYFVPFLFYLVFLLFKKNKKILKRFLMYVIGLLIITDIIFIPKENNSIALCLLGLWIIAIALYKLESSVSLLVSFVLFIVSAVFLPFYSQIILNKLSTYTYCFLLIGVVQMFFEKVNNVQKKEISAKKLILESFNLGIFRKRRNLKKSYEYGNVLDRESQIFKLDLYTRIGVKKFFKNKKILDLGCGYGTDSLLLAKFAKKVIGLDIHVYPEWKIFSSKKVKFLSGNCTNLPFRKNSFDGVYLKDLLHHLKNQEKIDATLAQIKKITKKNGKIIILEGNRYNFIFYFYTTLIKGHDHFTQKEFKSIIRTTYPQAKIISIEAYPPFRMPMFVYLIILKIEKNIEKIKIFRHFFSYNVALITNKK